MEKLMPEIVATASKVDIAPHVRDGYIMMFNYLPITFGDKFTPYVGPIIPCILKVGTRDHAAGSITGGAGCMCSPWSPGSLPARTGRQESSSCSYGSPISRGTGALGEAALADLLCMHRLLLMRMSSCGTPPCVRASGSFPCTPRRPLPCCCPSWSKASLMISGE